MSDISSEQPRRRGSRTRFDQTERRVIFIAIGVVVLAAIALVALLIITNETAANPSRAFDVKPRNIDLWAVYPDGRVRFVTMFYPDDEALATQGAATGEETVNAAGPLVASESAIISTKVIGGTEVTSEVNPGPGQDTALVYPLVSLTRTQNGDPYGVDVITSSSPYLTDATTAGVSDAPEGTQIVSLGIGESGVFTQVIVAVAFPKGTKVEVQGGEGNIESYRHINIGDWTIYYFDTSLSATTEAIRIHYVPKTGTPGDLDVKQVDSKR